MENRIIEILIRLKEQNGAIKVSDLAAVFNVSDRTIRNDLIKLESMLNSRGIRLRRNKRDGVSLLKNDAESPLLTEYIQKLSVERAYYSPEQRRKALIWALLDSDGTESFSSLAKTTGMGRTTTVADLNACEPWLQARGIAIERIARQGLKISGSEFHLRNAVLDHLWNDFDALDLSFFFGKRQLENPPMLDRISEQHLQMYMQEAQPEEFFPFIRQYEKRMGVRLTDRDFLRTVLYICISLSRIRHGHGINEPVLAPCWSLYYEKRAAEELDLIDCPAPLKALSESPFEMEGLTARLICSNLKEVNFGVYNVPLLSVELVNHFLRNVESILGVRLDQDGTMTGDLLQYIPVAVERLLHGIVHESPIGPQVRTLYPTIYAACIRAMDSFLQSHFGDRFSDYELDFLAMLLASAYTKVQTQAISANYVRIAVVCPNGVAVSKLLCANLQSHYSNLRIMHVLSVDEFLRQPPDVDAVIGNTPVTTKLPYIRVSPFLDKEDLCRIDLFLSRFNTKNAITAFCADNIANDVMRIVLEDNVINNPGQTYGKLLRYFQNPTGRPNLPPPFQSFLYSAGISVRFSAADSTEAIREAGRLLCEQGCTKPRYTECMIAIDQQYRSYIAILPHVALPHARPCDGVIAPGFSFVTLKDGVAFGHPENDPVRLVVGLAAGAGMQHANALMELISLLSEPGNVDMLCRCATPQEFLLQLETMFHLYRTGNGRCYENYENGGGSKPRKK